VRSQCVAAVTVVFWTRECDDTPKFHVPSQSNQEIIFLIRFGNARETHERGEHDFVCVQR